MSDVNRDDVWKSAKEQYKIQQIREEWEWLISNTVATWETKKNILEIGCYDGGSTYYLSNFANKMRTIDNNVPCRFDPCSIPCLDYEYIGGDSHDPDILKSVLSTDWDFAFIDGDHSYEGVKADFQNVRGFLKSGTPVAFHDIVISDYHHAHGCYVGEFWEDLKKANPTLKTLEFKTDSEWGGIGIVFIP
jgi:predicted O-methyltransferase YrrM